MDLQTRHITYLLDNYKFAEIKELLSDKKTTQPLYLFYFVVKDITPEIVEEVFDTDRLQDNFDLLYNVIQDTPDILRHSDYTRNMSTEDLQNTLFKYLIKYSNTVSFFTALIKMCVKYDNNTIKHLLEQSNISDELLVEAFTNVVHNIVEERSKDFYTNTERKHDNNYYKTIVSKVLDLFIELVYTIPKHLLVNVAYIYGRGYIMLFGTIVDDPKYLEILLKQKYRVSDNITNEYNFEIDTFIKQICDHIILSGSVEPFTKFMEIYNEHISSQDLYTAFYIKLFTIKDKHVLSQFKKIFLCYYDPYELEDKKELIEHMIWQNNHGALNMNSCAVYRELKLLGYKLEQHDFERHRLAILNVYTLKELIEHGIVYTKDMYNIKLEYNDVMSIYLLNKNNYIDDVKEFYTDLEKLTSFDCIEYQVEDNIVFKLFNNSITKSIIEYV